jgi:hypothetical protein
MPTKTKPAPQLKSSAATLHNPPATLETAQKLGLLPEEFDRICEVLGRTPNFTELASTAPCGASIAPTRTPSTC